MAGFEYKASEGTLVKAGALRRIFGLIASYKWLLWVSVVLTLGASIAGPTLPFLTHKIIDQEILGGDQSGLTKWIALALGVLVLNNVMVYAQSMVTNFLGQQAVLRLRKRVFAHIIRLRLRVFDRTPIGTMITRTVSDVEAVADIFSEGLIAIIGDTLQIIIILCYMFWIDWYLTLVSLSVFPILLIAAYIFKEKVKVSFQTVRSKVNQLNTFLQERITGMAVVQIFNRQDKDYELFKKINADHRDANVKGILYYSVFFPVIEILSASAIALVVWGAAKGVLREETTLGIMVAFISYINLLFRPIRQIADKFNTLQMGMIAADRVFQVIDYAEHEPDKGAKEFTTLEKELRFEKVWFSYNDMDWVLRDVSFGIKKGETLAIVGPTGAGKTSISALVNRLYPYQKGAVKLDGTPIEEFGLEQLRSRIGVVLQDVFLFSDTIRNNIRMHSPNITDAEIMAAAEAIGAKEFIDRLPEGLDTEVGERGGLLSLGQRQLISFIRAMLQNPEILILDEATASVDQETEDMIQHAIRTLLSGRTSIVIAHRLSTIRSADLILVLRKGEVEEIGSHEELVKREGLYRQLHDLQFEDAA